MKGLEIQYLTLACQMSEAQANDPFIGNADALLLVLDEQGITEKQVWDCQLSLKRAAYIRLHATYDVEPVEPTWSQSAPEFTILPKGLDWWSKNKAAIVGRS